MVVRDGEGWKGEKEQEVQEGEGKKKRGEKMRGGGRQDEKCRELHKMRTARYSSVNLSNSQSKSSI